MEIKFFMYGVGFGYLTVVVALILVALVHGTAGLGKTEAEKEDGP